MGRELFEEWLGFLRLSPPLGTRVDKAAGIIAHTDFAINSGKDGKDKYKIEDFEPIWFECDRPLAEPQTPQQKAEAGDAWCDLLKKMRETKRGNHDRQPGP